MLTPFANVHTFNNLTPAGTPSYGWDLTTAPDKRLDEAVTVIDDVLTLALL